MTTATLRKTAPLKPPVEPVSRPPLRFTVGQFQAMGEVGIFSSGVRVELLEGVVVEKMPQNEWHVWDVAVLGEWFVAHLPAGWTYRSQGPIILEPYNMPEPDGVLARGTRANYRKHGHPKPADIGLVIEVSDSTLASDRGEKLQVYARAKLPEYWVVNIPERKVEVYTKPRGGRFPAYLSCVECRAGQSIPVEPDGVAGTPFPVAELFDEDDES